MGYWIDYIKHTIQRIVGQTGGGLLDRLHKTYNAMNRGYKGVGYWIDYIKHTIQCIEGTTGGGLLDRLHKT